MPGWNDAALSFVPAGTTLGGLPPDADENVIHVDTGKGAFDHHQFKERLSATLVVLRYLEAHGLLPTEDIAALRRLADYATVIDNFGEVEFPDPSADVYDLSLGSLIDGLAAIEPDDEKLARMSFPLIDASFALLKKKVVAENELNSGISFESNIGKALAIETTSEETVKLAQKKGYQLVARKDPVKGFVRIKTSPNDAYDLGTVYEKIKAADPEADWFLHASRNMLLNGSSKNPGAKPSSLTLQQVTEILKSTHI